MNTLILLKTHQKKIAAPYIGHFIDTDDVWCVEIFGEIGRLPGDKEFIKSIDQTDIILKVITIDTEKSILDRRDRVIQYASEKLSQDSLNSNVREKLLWLIDYANSIRIIHPDENI